MRLIYLIFYKNYKCSCNNYLTDVTHQNAEDCLWHSTQSVMICNNNVHLLQSGQCRSRSYPNQSCHLLHCSPSPAWQPRPSPPLLLSSSHVRTHIRKLTRRFLSLTVFHHVTDDSDEDNHKTIFLDCPHITWALVWDVWKRLYGLILLTIKLQLVWPLWRS